MLIVLQSLGNYLNGNQTAVAVIFVEGITDTEVPVAIAVVVELNNRRFRHA